MSDVRAHPVVLAARGLPSDQQEAAAREAEQIETALAAVEALSTDDPEARRVIRDAAARLGTLYTYYASNASAGYVPPPGVPTFGRWYHAALVRLRARAIECLGETEGRRLICIPWEPLP